MHFCSSMYSSQNILLLNTVYLMYLFNAFCLVMKCLFCLHYSKKKKTLPTQTDNALCDINDCNFIRSRRLSWWEVTLQT